MQNLKTISITAILFIMFASCSMQKRRYNQGLNVEWFGNSTHAKKVDILINMTEQNSLNQATIANRPMVYFEVSSLLIPSDVRDIKVNRKTQNITNQTSENFPFSVNSFDTIKCDVIIMKSGEEISAKVTEVGEDLIKYKLCDNQDGPLFIITRSKVFMIKYPNGTKTVFSNLESNKSQTQTSDSKPSDIRRENNTTVIA